MTEEPWHAVIKNRDGSTTVVTKAGNHLTVPAGVIPPAGWYIDNVLNAPTKETK